MSESRWFWRAIEGVDGWGCHRGLTELDRHPTLPDALRHLFSIAEQTGRSEVFAHYLDGRVESVAVFD